MTDLIYNKRQNISYFDLEYALDGRQAKFIMKLDYWIKRSGHLLADNKGLWIFNKIEEWARQLNCSISTVKRTTKKLEDAELIYTQKVNAKRGDQTKWYSINYDKLLSMIEKVPKSSPTLPKKIKWAIPLAHKHQAINNNRNNCTKLRRREREEPIQMVKLWNNVFEYSLSPIKAFNTEEINRQLLRILINKFQGNMDNWVKYAKDVNSSRFLMGEKTTKNSFKAIFKWLIKDNTVEEIIAGGYGIGDRTLDMNKIKENTEEQEKNLTSTIENKITQYIKDNINHTKEELEFIKYVNDRSHGEDKYGLKKILQHYESYSLIHMDNYAGIKRNLYEQFIMKKHLGITKIEARNQIKARIQSMKYNNQNEDLFKIMQNEIQAIKNTLIEKIPVLCQKYLKKM